MVDDILLDAVEECHCIVTAIYRLLNSQIPEQCRRLFEEKCLEASNALRSTVNGHTNNSPSSHQLNTSNSFEYPPNLYRPPARRQSSTTSAGSVQDNSNQRPTNGRAVKQIPIVSRPKMCEVSTQTFSTGEITVLQVYYDT